VAEPGRDRTRDEDASAVGEASFWVADLFTVRYPNQAMHLAFGSRLLETVLGSQEVLQIPPKYTLFKDVIKFVMSQNKQKEQLTCKNRKFWTLKNCWSSAYVLKSVVRDSKSLNSFRLLMLQTIFQKIETSGVVVLLQLPGSIA